jgi:starch phosphorylase
MDFRKVKRSNKQKLGRLIGDTLRLETDPDSLFDIHIKRIHAYKRQLLNVMHILDEYLSLIEDRRTPLVPRTYVFAGKAAPGYWAAKQIIKLIHSLTRVVNGDRRARSWIRIAFLPDYRVSLAEKIIPAADLSEQISTAGAEASGTSNMKLALNGALTIGTLDGANIEIFEEVGRENAFTFGATAAETKAWRERGSYRPREIYERDARIRRIVDAFSSDLLSPREPGLFVWISDLLLEPQDEYFHLADLPGYLDAHQTAGCAFRDPDRWATMSIRTVARMGKFSSDRAIREYAREIWGIESV